jgi:hypothetical protein
MEATDGNTQEQMQDFDQESNYRIVIVYGV